ncbi:hypothetical protein CTAYLR_002572 [Chrysophaeum taylorii]|uniref:DNA-directed RNA polymerases I, II, and III subunit RPABC1 n=1 Tax=Chrysophaeum taylorii TaxID=2483200 RepID=A0AAD7UF73_9STRA|nr:hypothetical protein CTAYLR_002572 [Chrysophaeum taylorii]
MDVNAPFRFDEWRPLQLAAAEGDDEAVRGLLAAGARVGAISTSRCRPCHAALHVAARYGQVSVVRILVIEAGADVNLRDSHGFTPLLYAVVGGHPATVNELLGHGADDTARALAIARAKGLDAIATALDTGGTHNHHKLRRWLQTIGCEAYLGTMAQQQQSLSSEAMHLFRIRRTVLKMLKKRSYIVDPVALEMDASAFQEQFGDKPKRGDQTILAEHETDPDDQIFVFLPEEDKVGVKTIKSYCDLMQEAHVTHAILVVKQGITPFAKTALQEMSPFTMEHFRDNELLVDITEHKLVPTHQPLSPDDKAALLKRYKLKEAQLPRIQRTDPVARYFGLKTGDVVKIIRPSETAGRYVTYRVCL